MIPARVIGRVVPAQTLPAFKGVKFLLVQPIDERLAPVGSPVVCCDSIGANTGELVFLAQGREATFVLPDGFNPADMTIIAIIDEITDDGQSLPAAKAVKIEKTAGEPGSKSAVKKTGGKARS